ALARHRPPPLHREVARLRYAAHRRGCGGAGGEGYFVLAGGWLCGRGLGIIKTCSSAATIIRGGTFWLVLVRVLVAWRWAPCRCSMLVVNRRNSVRSIR